MAENEILDVGSRQNYRRWLAVVADPKVSTTEAAGRLAEDCLAVLTRKLRKQPLYIVLKACGEDLYALQAAVASLKDASLGRWVETAYRISPSLEPSIIAHKIAELLIDAVRDQATRFAMRRDLGISEERQRQLDIATRTALEGSKEQIAKTLELSLRNETPPRIIKRASRPLQHAKSLLKRSLLPAPRSHQKPSGHV